MLRRAVFAALLAATSIGTADAGVTKQPKLIQAQAPDYPPAALAAGKTAKVKVRLHIDADGIVTAVDVVERVGDGFDEAAVAAAMQYIFDPAEIDGKPGPIVV
ncbi:MAG TPA: energy transducer TonB, partial [Kofleriaceae bacterium]|nr:energy transducer TonB [Kofleriaceae bacterium]